MSALAGLIPPICTPLTTKREVDEVSLRSIIEFQIAAGASGIFVLGSSGEAIYLDDAERVRVGQIAREAVGSRVPLLVGALAPTARRVAEQFTLLEKVKADAFVVTAPFYAQSSAGEIVDHFRIVAQAASAPVLAYDIPGNVGYKLPTDVVIGLLKEGAIAGLKDSSGNVDELARIESALGPGRVGALLSGADTAALRALDAGADGLIPGLSNIRPDLFLDLLVAHAAGDEDRAVALQRAITALNGIFRIGAEHGLGRHAAEVGALKHVLERNGVIQSTASPVPLESYPAAAGEAASALMIEVDRRLAEDLVTNEGRRP